jgi:hypothetical protein
VIAFATSLILALSGNAAVLLYSKRRVPGSPLSWGEAMAAAIFVFLIMNLWYGVVPHQWITLADSEWNWRSDRVLYGIGNVFKPEALGGFLPFTITYQALRDIIVTVIYGAALGLHVFHFSHWQNRSKVKPEIVPTTTYGRPLARKS